MPPFSIHIYFTGARSISRGQEATTLEVPLFPDRPISGAEAEQWAERGLKARLPIELITDEAQTPPPLALEQGGQAVGRLEEARLLVKTREEVRLVGVAGRWEGQPMRGMVDKGSLGLNLEDVRSYEAVQL